MQSSRWALQGSIDDDSLETQTGELISKTKDVESKKALFKRKLRAKGLEDAALSAAQLKSFSVGDWHFNPATPNGTSIHLMSAQGVDN